jgi:hypothetical protein
VPWPDSIVPFVAVHSHVVPSPAAGTDATWPPEPAQTSEGAVIVAAEASGKTMTRVDPVPGTVQVPFETVTTE